METIGTAESILQTKSREVFAVPPETTVYEAIRQLSERNVGALLVMEGSRLLGVFSERDYTRKIALQGRNSRETSVGEIVSCEIVSASPDSSISECMKLMTSNRVRHLPVMRGDRVVGVLSIGDLVNWIIRTQDATICSLENYIAGGYPG